MKAINTVTIVGANGAIGRNIAVILASFGNAKVYLVSRIIEKYNLDEKRYKDALLESRL